MAARQLGGGGGSGTLCRGLSRIRCGQYVVGKTTRPMSLSCRPSAIPNGLGCQNVAVSCLLSTKGRILLSPLVTRRRKPHIGVLRNQLGSGYGAELTSFQERLVLEEEELGVNNPLLEEESESNGVAVNQPKSSDVKRELVTLTLPAIAGQAIDPLAQLMETAYIGRLGSVELGSAGVSITIFNNISKLFNIPLLSVATSFVAEDISKNSINGLAPEKGFHEDITNGKAVDTVTERKQLSSVSTALLLAVGIGMFEAVALSLGSGPFLTMMGVTYDSPMRIPAERVLSLRALGAPAVVVSLALQGIFRGFKDTKTPVFCLGLGNLSAVFLFPILMYYFKLGVTGAAISTIASQYTVTFLMIWNLSKKVILLPPKMGALQFGLYMKSGEFFFQVKIQKLFCVVQ
uniref:Uncharacterized protein MANES_04G064900 n=1 Tax=Rhizophora mucronata TaxID=61149 RepID=A0A2P2IXQ5_RHIMU